MTILPNWIEIGSRAYAASPPSFGGLGKAGLITTIIISVIIIVTVVWLINGTKKRD